MDVVVDSNAVYSKDPTRVASGKFETSWKKCCGLAKLRLLVPEIVKGERLYQLSTVALAAVENAKKNFNTIAGVCGRVPPKMPTPQEVRAEVEQQFDKWLAANSGVIVPLPYDAIDWKQVVHDAVWRVSPFVPPSDETDSEKGFRDCLVLRTLEKVLATAKGRQVVFICNDNILRNAARLRFPPEVFAAYDLVAAFESYLTLARDQQNAAFAKAVLEKAASIFYSDTNAECVYIKLGIIEKIYEQHAFSLEHIFEAGRPWLDYLTVKAPDPAPTYNDLMVSALNSSAVSPEKIFFDSTTYDAVLDGGSIKWKSQLRLVRLFAAPSKYSFLPPEERVRIAPFDVYWTSTIDADLNFSNLQLDKIEALPQRTEAGFNAITYGLARTFVPVVQKSP